MVNSRPYSLEGDIVPQAIVSRSILFFSARFREEVDEFDSFHVASYALGNRLVFDLRHYAGHPPLTVTLYVSLQNALDDEVTDLVTQALAQLGTPPYSIAWRHGQAFRFGELRRNPRDRIYEREARLLALKIAAQCLNRRASTDYIKRMTPAYTSLSEADLKPSTSRRNEQMWQQIIGNVISHRDSPQGPFRRGFATRTNDGLEVTDRGVDYLNSLGFSL